MIKSMTGFGRGRLIADGKDILVEIRSVNHRYLDISVKYPRNYGFLEDKLRQLVQSEISRGKIDIYVGIETVDSGESGISLDHGYTAGYLKALYELRDTYSLSDDITTMRVAANRDIFLVHRADEDADALWKSVSDTARIALGEFSSMRLREGEKLRSDIEYRAGLCGDYANRIAVLSEKTVLSWKERFATRLKELLDGVAVDEARILTEAAIYADKICITEEITRLGSHFTQLAGILKNEGAVGRKLDFLIQEVNREINTIGSKSGDSDIAMLVVETKSELEKIREQIQNIE